MLGLACCWSALLLATPLVFALAKPQVIPRRTSPLRDQDFREIYGEELPSYRKYSKQGGPGQHSPNRIQVQVFPPSSIHLPRKPLSGSLRHPSLRHDIFADHKSRLPIRPRRRTQDTATVISCPKGVFRGDRLLLPLKRAYFYQPIDPNVVADLSASSSSMQTFQLSGPIPKRGKYAIRMAVLAPHHHKILVCHYWYNLKDVPKCPPPPIPKNGQVNCITRAIRERVCHFTCLQGYQLLGEPVTRCQNNGSWSHPTPSCQSSDTKKDETDKRPSTNGEDISCTPPDFNATKVEIECSQGATPRPGTLCGLRCPEGLESIYPSVLCLATGKWNLTLDDSICIPSAKPSCPKLAPIPHGKVRCVANGTRCRYECHPGFVIPTSQLPLSGAVCAGSSWNVSSQPECKKQVAPRVVPKKDCRPRKMNLPPKGPLRLRPPRFRNAAGKLARGRCDVARIEQPGRYRVECHSWDHELRVGAVCRFTLTVTQTKCPPIKPPKNGSIACSQKVLLPGTKCKIGCRKGYSPSEVKLICDNTGKWSPGSFQIECLEMVPPKLSEECRDQTFEIEEGEEVNLTLPEFFSGRDGSLLTTTCSLPSKLAAVSSNLTNICTSKDPVLNTTSSCTYNIYFTATRKECSPLTASANSHLICSDIANITNCLFTCETNYHLPPALETLSNRSLTCDYRKGQWNFQITEGISELPDCVRNLPTTVFQRSLSFQGLTQDCSGHNITGEFIKTTLLEVTGKICSKVDCSNFTQTCEPSAEGLSLLTSVWTIRAVYVPTDDEEEYIEAEANIEAIQVYANTLIKSNKSFEDTLKEKKLELVKKSFQVDNFILICQEKGFYVDLFSQRCMECPRGTAELWGTCVPCSPGFYQDKTGQAKCKPCSSSGVDSGSLTGARSPLECRSKAN